MREGIKQAKKALKMTVVVCITTKILASGLLHDATYSHFFWFTGEIESTHICQALLPNCRQQKKKILNGRGYEPFVLYFTTFI